MSANTVNWGATVPTEVLETTASAQRIKLHESFNELRSHMHEALDVRRRVQDYLVPASAVVAGFGLMVGFGMAGMFSPVSPPRRQRVR
jgi:hypothetical protein